MTEIASLLSEPIALLPTFFDEGGLALGSQTAHASRLLAAGCRAMVVGGAEGEGPTLEEREVDRLILSLVGLSASPAIGLSIWTPCTQTAQGQAARAEQAGAAFLVVSPPPYSRPTQEGLRKHVESILASTGLPVVVRDDPSRTRIGLSDRTLIDLCRTGIAALALAPGDMRRANLIDHESRGLVPVLCGSDFDAVLGQCDARSGWLSSATNIDPERCRGLQRARLTDDWRSATLLSRDLCRLLRALELAEPAISVKYALSRIGSTEPDTRLPLVPLPQGTGLVIDAALHALGVNGDPTLAVS